MEKHSADEKIERAFAIERAARQYDPRIVITRRIAYSERESLEALANTLGVAAEQRNNGCGGGGMVIARADKEQQVGGGSDSKRRYAEFDPAKIGSEAAEKAVMMLGATNAATQRASILLEPKMTGAFLGIIANLVSADNVQKGKSLFAGKIGKAVAAAGVTVVDDGAFVGAPGMRAFDDEGVPSQRTVVIENGVLQNYLHSTYTARKARARATGNAARASFKHAPDAQPSNFYLVAGTESADALRAGIARGLWVRNLMNLHTANPISGEFSFGANGLWIENGKIVGPVRGVTISGNLTDLLVNLRGIGSDVVWQGGFGASVGAPSVVIEDVSIAGK
jgi:PmbA protein